LHKRVVNITPVLFTKMIVLAVAPAACIKRVVDITPVLFTKMIVLAVASAARMKMAAAVLTPCTNNACG
jgi:hypothetical protein